MNRIEMKSFLLDFLPKYKRIDPVPFVLHKKYPEIYNNIISLTFYLKANCSFTERIYHIVNDLSEAPICPICKQAPKLFLSFYREYTKTCSPKCGAILDGLNRRDKPLSSDTLKSFRKSWEKVKIKRKEEGYISPLKGKKLGSFSEEHKQALRKPKSEKGRKNISNAAKNRKITESRIASAASPITKKKRETTLLNKYGVTNSFNVSKLKGTNYNSSKISIDLFSKVASLIDLEEIYFNNKEYFLRESNSKKIHFYDFTIPSKKKIIEFYGDFWHGNPKIYNKDSLVHETKVEVIWENDKKKVQIAKDNGFDVLIIWESDYLSSPNEVVLKCVDFLTDDSEALLNDEWEVLTPDGFKDSLGCNKTIHYKWLTITLENGLTLTCSNEHKLKIIDGFKYAKDISKDDYIETNEGFKKVISITKENGKKEFYDLIEVGTKHEYYTNNIVSHNCQLLFLDEFAFVRRGVADEFFASVYPTISAAKDSKIIIVSTPKGLNHFYEIWSKAIKKRNAFAPFRVDWHEVEGRDEAWKLETIKNIGQIKFNQEYGNLFLGSTSTLINGPYLERMDPAEAIKNEHNLKIYSYPIPGHIYCIGNDIAKGTGSDYSVCQVLDITKFPFEQVAVYRNNMINTRKFGDKVVELGKYYNNAYLMIENNDIGQATVDHIWYDLDYENLVNLGGNIRKDIGIRSTKKTKPRALDILKDLIESDKLKVVDSDSIYELSKFIEVKENVYKADDKEKDDCVTSLMWASYIVETPFMDDKLKDNFTRGADVEEEISGNEELPLPYLPGYDENEDSNWLIQ